MRLRWEGVSAQRLTCRTSLLRSILSCRDWASRRAVVPARNGSLGAVWLTLCRPIFSIVGETSYNHAGQTNISFSQGSAKIGLSLTDFTGGVQYQFPVGSKQFVPYVSAEVGGIREAASASGSALPVNISATTTALALEFGGGVRYYIRPSWGIRPEATVVRIPGQTYMRFGIGCSGSPRAKPARECQQSLRRLPLGAAAWTMTRNPSRNRHHPRETGDAHWRQRTSEIKNHLLILNLALVPALLAQEVTFRKSNNFLLSNPKK